VLGVVSLFGGAVFGFVVSVEVVLVVSVVNELISGGVGFVAEFVVDEGFGVVWVAVGVGCVQFGSGVSFSVGVMSGVGALVVLGL
jgi:hypothetical protein